MRSNSVSCRWVRGRLPLYAGGELLGEDRRSVEQHVLRCERCRAELSADRAAVEVLRVAAARDPVSSHVGSLAPALLLRLRDAARPEVATVAQGRARARPSWVRFGMAAAAVLLVGLASAWLWPTARQYRVSVAMNRVPPVRIHRVATVRPMSSLRSATFGTRRASLIRELPQEPVAIERQVGSEQTGLTN